MKEVAVAEAAVRITRKEHPSVAYERISKEVVVMIERGDDPDDIHRYMQTMPEDAFRWLTAKIVHDSEIRERWGIEGDSPVIRPAITKGTTNVEV